MYKNVKFSDLERVLNRLDFETNDGKGKHVIFRHKSTGTVVSIPRGTAPMRTIFVNTVARQVANSGIVSAEGFARRLEDATKMGVQSPKIRK